MKKIIIGFDGIHYPQGAFEFARRLNTLHPVFLTAVFVSQTQLSTTNYNEEKHGYIPLLEGTEAEVVLRNIEDFEKQCKENNIAYSIHRDFNGFALPELKHESLYADLLLLGTEVFYTGAGTENPNTYLKTLLHESKCPVILVPEKFQFPERIVIGFNSSNDSIFALKQFIYVLPEFTKLKTSIVWISKRKNKLFPDDKRLEEFAARHFSDYTIEVLNMDSKKIFYPWLAELRSPLLVCGSYGRSSFSQLIRKSFTDPVIREFNLPVFITHS